MSEFQQAAIKETENFAKTPKEKPCQQIFNRGLSLSTASLTGCEFSGANTIVASSACWYQMFQQAIRLAIHFARRYLLGLAPNPRNTEVPSAATRSCKTLKVEGISHLSRQIEEENNSQMA